MTNEELAVLIFLMLILMFATLGFFISSQKKTNAKMICETILLLGIMASIILIIN